jgi:undecaprenyl-diphosphatase
VNDYILSVLLGIVEGLTEFLPVSSTAHLRITEALLHVPLADPYWKMYTVVIQLGAILALLLLFLTRVVDLLRTWPTGERGNKNKWNHPLSLIAIAFVVTAIPAFLLHKLVDKHLESLTIIAWALLLGGILMWIVDIWSTANDPRTRSIEDITVPQAIWVGFCQIFSAVFPGTSRSMSTITGGQIVGMTRPTALEFSFLLSIPIMVTSTGYELLRTLHPKAGDFGDAAMSLVMSTHRWIVLAIGLFISFLVALGVVDWFLNWVRSHGFGVFAAYRIILGIALLIWGKHIH